MSWNPDIKAWVIAQKNAGLVARSREDIERYDVSRYKYAIEIARTWFDIIEPLKTTGVLKEFKEQI